MGLSSALTRLAEDMAAGFKLAASPERSPVANMFIGPRFATDDELMQLRKAQAILSRPSAARDQMRAREGVWKETGWFGWGDDGLTLKHPQMRVSDYGTDFRPGVREAGPLEATLGEVYDHPEMAARMGSAYDTFPVTIRSIGREGATFWRKWNPQLRDFEPKSIEIGTETFQPGSKINPRAALLHEVNHYDQALNAQPNGGSWDKDRFLEARDWADAQAIAGHMLASGYTRRRPDMDGILAMMRAEKEAAAAIGIEHDVPTRLVSRFVNDSLDTPASVDDETKFALNPARGAFIDHMNLPLLNPQKVYQQGGSGRGELPAWQTYWEALDNRPPAQEANVPPFRTMFPQSLHGATHDNRTARIRAIADMIRTGGGLGALSAAVGGASQYARDQDPSGGLL